MKGYIVKGIGGFYYVKTEEGVIECKPRGIFRKQKITPVAGDEVTLETENGAAVIAEIAPMKDPLCPSLPSATTAGKGWTRSGSGSAGGSAPSAATPV